MQIPKALRIKTKKFSPVWLTPILALIITGWLIYNGYVNSGKEIRVQFNSGSDIVIGKTLLKYRGIPIGKVVDLEVADSLDKVNVVIKLQKEASGLAKEGTLFWIVKPRVSINQVTGLETILSGTYIEVRPPTYNLKKLNEMKDTDFFIGLSEPPSVDYSVDGVIVKLFARKDYGIYRGMSIYYNNLNAGQVQDVKFDSDRHIFNVTAVIDKNYEKYVNSGTKFWNISGFDIKMDSAGLKVQSTSLNSLLQGGLAFDSDKKTEKSEPMKTYEIAGDYSATLLSSRDIKIYMPESYGVKPNRTPVMYKGIQIGVVTDIRLDKKHSAVAVYVRMDKQYDYLAVSGTRFVIEQPEISMSGAKNLSSVLLGSYLNVAAGTGKPVSEFYLSDRPVVNVPSGSFPLVLTADKTAALDTGTGIYFRGIRIGMVTDYAVKNKKPIYKAVIFPTYRQFAVRGLYLWQPDLLDVGFSGAGVSVSASSAAQSLQGGVSAGFPGGETGGALRSGTMLHVYSGERDAEKAFLMTRGYRELRLYADDADGLSDGAPLSFRGVQTGEIVGTKLNENTDKVEVTAVVYDKYRKLLNNRLFFWKSGGAAVSAGITGVSVSVPSVRDMVTGGIAFDIDDTGRANGSYVYAGRTDADRDLKKLSAGRIMRLYYSDANPPYEGAPVLFKGVETGQTGETGYDRARRSPYIMVMIDKKYSDTVTSSTRFWSGGSASVSLDSEGVKMKTEPALNYIRGAVYYDSFAGAGRSGVLYADRTSAEKPDYGYAEVYLASDSALSAGAPVVSDGTKVGYVDKVGGTGNSRKAEIYLLPQYRQYLADGAVFWIDDLDVSLNGVRNAKAAVFGSNLAMNPGTGKSRSIFRISDAPLAAYAGADNLHIVLTSPSRNSLEKGSPVYYRQVQTGAVEWVRLSDKADRVEIGVVIDGRYADLIRTNTVFRSVSGVQASYGLFRGLKVSAESAKTILNGGIEFTTDTNLGERLKNGSVIPLN